MGEKEDGSHDMTKEMCERDQRRERDNEKVNGSDLDPACPY